MGWHERRAWLMLVGLVMGVSLAITVFDLWIGLAIGVVYALGLVTGGISVVLLMRGQALDDKRERETLERWRWPT
jgi:hypothetical protein